MTAGILAALVAASVSAAAQPATIRWLRRRDVVDVSNERSSHVGAVPRGGSGLAVALLAGALAWRLLASDPGDARAAAAIGCAWALLFVVGLVDDVHGLPALPRLAGQAVAGLLLAAGLVDAGVLWWGGAVAVVWVAAVTNAVNFMDGINGISGSTAVVAGVYYGVLAGGLGSSLLAGAGLVVAGAFLGYLPYNAVRPRLFMGDSGSYLLGGVLATCSLLAWSAGASLFAAVAPLLPYLADTGAALVRRALGRRPLLTAHREHTYQQLADLTGGHVRATLLVATAVAVCAAAGLATSGPAAWALAGSVIGVYLALPWVWRRLEGRVHRAVRADLGGT